ncbi:MAG: hypothetical protein IM568_12550 [Flavobacterium sp.]|nr:hypothetical protein [Flavobacterium sp.]
MRKLIIKFLAIVFISFVMISCGEKSTQVKITPEKELDIVKKCLVRLDSIRPNGYLVSPRFQNFEFNSFPRQNSFREGYDYDENKNEILESLQWNNEDFLITQKKVNKEYLDKVNPAFLKLSKGKIHNEVVLFSGIDKNLVFVNIIDYCNAVNSSDLALTTFNKNQRYSSVACYIFTLKDGNIQKMSRDGVLTKEVQCNESDVRVDE